MAAKTKDCSRKLLSRRPSSRLPLEVERRASPPGHHNCVHCGRDARPSPLERKFAPKENPTQRAGFYPKLRENLYTLNDDPQPHVLFTFGFSNLNPAPSRVST